jgi:hypothetical protein
MKKSILFALDTKTQETIISETKKGSNEITFIERINRNDNKLLFDAVALLTEITHSPDFDVEIFKSMDKVCQLIYAQKSID